jgi:hypothetical protein
MKFLEYFLFSFMKSYVMPALKQFSNSFEAKQGWRCCFDPDRNSIYAHIP